jgi:hypothetical protein
MGPGYPMTARVPPNRTKASAPITPTAAVNMNAAVQVPVASTSQPVMLTAKASA